MPAAVLTWAEWLTEGEQVRVSAGPGRRRHVMFRRVVRGPRTWVTFLHGFPTSSWDWAKVDAVLPRDMPRMYLDHLGFGASEKPFPYRYTIDEQLELVRAEWRDLRIENTALVVHDYSVSIALELLARMHEKRWKGPGITGILFLNGGLFYSRQRPLPIQRVLRAPIIGRLAAGVVTESTFQRNMRRIVHPDHMWTEDELAQHWRGIQTNGGLRVSHAVSAYHRERRLNEARWETALAKADVPLRAAWGMADPISGAPMAEHLQEAHPHVDLVKWRDVGHYPHCEVPARVAGQVYHIAPA